MQDHDWIENVKIFRFDIEVIAAFSEEEAIEFYEKEGGFDNEDCEPGEELELDDKVYDTSDEEAPDGHCCPFCDRVYRETTFREMLRDYQKDQLPVSIATTEE